MSFLKRLFGGGGEKVDAPVVAKEIEHKGFIIRATPYKRDGQYQTSDKPTVNKRWQYRVVMPATTHHKRGVSQTVVVDVFKWTSLTTADFREFRPIDGMRSTT